jgi:hypothetical protein
MRYDTPENIMRDREKTERERIIGEIEIERRNISAQQREEREARRLENLRRKLRGMPTIEEEEEMKRQEEIARERAALFDRLRQESVSRSEAGLALGRESLAKLQQQMPRITSKPRRVFL